MLQVGLCQSNSTGGHVSQEEYARLTVDTLGKCSGRKPIFYEWALFYEQKTEIMFID